MKGNFSVYNAKGRARFVSPLIEAGITNPKHLTALWKMWVDCLNASGDGNEYEALLQFEIDFNQFAIANNYELRFVGNSYCFPTQFVVVKNKSLIEQARIFDKVPKNMTLKIAAFGPDFYCTDSKLRPIRFITAKQAAILIGETS